jgi:hypothetical protein
VVASVVCSIGIRVTCEESGDGPGDGSPLHALFFFFSFQPFIFWINLYDLYRLGKNLGAFRHA